jgi:hypothetical protein
MNATNANTLPPRPCDAFGPHSHHQSALKLTRLSRDN